MTSTTHTGAIGAGAVEAEAIVNSDAVIRTFAACEWGELGEDGQQWVRAIVAETKRRAAALATPSPTAASDTSDLAFETLNPKGLEKAIQAYATEHLLPHRDKDVWDWEATKATVSNIVTAYLAAPAPAMVETTATTDAELVERIARLALPDAFACGPEAFGLKPGDPAFERTMVYGAQQVARERARGICALFASRNSALSAEVERLTKERDEARIASKSDGWLYHNPDTGTEWSENHPAESGEVPDASDIRPGTATAFQGELIPAWEGLRSAEARALAAERQRDDLKAALEKAREALDTALSELRDYADTHPAYREISNAIELCAALARLPSEPVPSPSGEEERPKPLAWMRRWAFDGVDVMKMPKAERPRGWAYHNVTPSQMMPDDVPLYALQEPR